RRAGHRRLQGGGQSARRLIRERGVSTPRRPQGLRGRLLLPARKTRHARFEPRGARPPIPTPRGAAALMLIMLGLMAGAVAFMFLLTAVLSLLHKHFEYRRADMITLFTCVTLIGLA